jgi:hypothetical protein
MSKTRARLSKEQRASRPTFEERVSQAAKDLENQAWRLPPGPERDNLLRRARRMDVANHMNELATVARASVAEVISGLHACETSSGRPPRYREPRTLQMIASATISSLAKIVRRPMRFTL